MVATVFGCVYLLLVLFLAVLTLTPPGYVSSGKDSSSLGLLITMVAFIFSWDVVVVRRSLLDGSWTRA